MIDVFYLDKKPGLFPHERKAESIEHARQMSRTDSCWIVSYLADYSDFDFLWQPVPWQQQYIHVWPSQWHDYSGTCWVPLQGTTSWHCHSTVIPNRASRANWQVLHNIDQDRWDWTWAPHPLDPPFIYVWGNQWWSAEKMPTVEYRVPGATERKFMDTPARLLSTNANWHLPDCIDVYSVDQSWCPDPGDPPYIYEFATQWQPNGGARYVMPGATEIKYVNIQHRRLPDRSHWKVLHHIEKFDYSWHPDNTEPPYDYVFGNQHWPGTEMPTVIYSMTGAEQQKFVDQPVAKLGAAMANWQLCENIDINAWDWSWVPNPKDPPYIYVFGNQWNPPELKASLKYLVQGATEFKYMDRRTRRLPQPDLFENHLPVTEFDYSWEPNPTDPPMTYVFGNQWNEGVLEPTVTYSTGGTEIKYINDIVAKIAPNYGDQWQVLDEIEEFDYSWRPNPTDPPYCYVFGNQWLTPEQRPAVRYRVGSANEIKYMHHPRARRRGEPEKFEQLYPCEFDWSWEPDPGSPPYIYVFGNQYYTAEVMPTVEYHMPGATERKYMDLPAQLLPRHDNHWHTKIDCEWDYSWRPEPGSPPYIFVFGNQWWPAEKMATVEYHMPGATERKYMTGPVARLLVDMTHWHLPDNVDTTDMDFSWVPDPGEPPYIYQFATQHQKTGGPQYRVPGAVEIKYVDMMRAEVKKDAAPIFEIDHLDGNAGLIPNTVKKIRYFDNYRDTLIRLARSLVGEYEHVWVCSSICDYKDFDFSWHPETWQSTMLHVFASDEQKFGDTFYMHVPTFAERAEKKQLLEWYAVNYVPRVRVPRRPMPVVYHTQDTHVDTVKNSDFTAPLALFTVEPHIDRTSVTVPLWRQELKTITPISRGAGSVIVPKSAVGAVRTQLYDYPNIDKTKVMLRGQPLDIVFISNGEPNAVANLTRLKAVVTADVDRTNQIHAVSGVNGRAAAYHAAARASTTPWFFAVFAKLKVTPEFDWTWQPDRMQQAKHYIFHARNPVNGLVYGHQAMIAYNRALVLANPGVGLDFTLDSPHEVVPLVSGTADYNTSAWSAWRTAFREAIKLRDSFPDVENEYRLERWLSANDSGHHVLYEDWSCWGAEDAVEYYDSVKGDFTELRKTYEWDWLASYAYFKRKLTPVQ